MVAALIFVLQAAITMYRNESTARTRSALALLHSGPEKFGCAVATLRSLAVIYVLGQCSSSANTRRTP